MTPRRFPITRTAVAAGLVVLAGLGSGAAARAASEPPLVSAEFCDGMFTLNGLLAAVPEEPAELTPYIDDELLPVVDTIVNELSDDLADTAGTYREALAAVAESGDPTPLFADAEVLAAQAELGRAVHVGCDATALDVLAKDYSFGGLPESIEAGRVSIAFVNEGEEEHELVLLRRPDDSDATLEDLLAESPDALFTQTEFAGVVFSAPGETGYTTLELEPGTYFAICMIPTGGEPEAEPHAAHGMTATLVVEATV